jgi:hypothetical protein
MALPPPRGNRSLAVLLAVAVGALVILVVVLAVVLDPPPDDELGEGEVVTVEPTMEDMVGIVSDDELIVFLHPVATEEQTEDVRTLLEDDERVEEVTFCDQACAYDEFQDLFSDDPGLIDSVTPAILPASFRVEIVDGEDAHAVGDGLDAEPGVREVAYPPS